MNNLAEIPVRGLFFLVAVINMGLCGMGIYQYTGNDIATILLTVVFTGAVFIIFNTAVKWIDSFNLTLRDTIFYSGYFVAVGAAVLGNLYATFLGCKGLGYIKGEHIELACIGCSVALFSFSVVNSALINKSSRYLNQLFAGRQKNLSKVVPMKKTA